MRALFFCFQVSKIQVVALGTREVTVSSPKDFTGLSKRDVLAVIEAEAERSAPDLEVVSYAFARLEGLGKTGKAESLLERYGLRPVPWLVEARCAVNSLIDRPPAGSRYRGHLYVVLLDFDEPGDYGAYVGSTMRRPSIRYQQHTVGDAKSSGIVRRRGLQLLPSLWLPSWRVPGGKPLLLWETALHRCLEKVLPANRVRGDVYKGEIPAGFQPQLFGKPG